MPKLSGYLQQHSVSEPGPSHSQPQNIVKEQSLSLQGKHQPASSQQLSRSFDRLRSEYEKRIDAHGPRTFRWPDGTLRQEKPPQSPYTAVNRQRWQQLVQHCRMHGGDKNFDKDGVSLRYGINVSYKEYRAYLNNIGLDPDIDQEGHQIGLELGSVANPLDDPTHCFNTYYKGSMEAVFKHRRGRLM